MTKNREGQLWDYLGRRVYVEAFGRKRFGVVCSVYKSESGKVTAEIEWADGCMDSRSFPTLRFVNEKTA